MISIPDIIRLAELKLFKPNLDSSWNQIFIGISDFINSYFFIEIPLKTY